MGGMDIIKANFLELRDSLDLDYQKEQHRSHQKISSGIFDFTKSPYRKGAAVPLFAFHSSDGSLLNNDGYLFDYLANDNHHVVLKKKDEEGNIKKLIITLKSYEAIIRNAFKYSIIKDKANITQKAAKPVAVIERNMPRVNTSYNFWHNLRCQCFLYANNSSEAVAVARALYRSLPAGEKQKFTSQSKKYQKLTNETVTDRVIRTFNDSIKGHPIQNKSVYSFHSIRQGIPYSDTLNTEGKTIDPLSSLKIGDSIKLSIIITDFCGKKSKLPIQAFTITAASKSLNKISLVSSDGLSKYIMDRENFIKQISKKDKNLEKRVPKQAHGQIFSYSYSR
jgi:hypothetical protein